jgi:periplasmic protein TonB
MFSAMPTSALPRPDLGPSRLAVALAVSLALHLVLLATLPGFPQPVAARKRQALEVFLVAAAAPPRAVAEPEPAMLPEPKTAPAPPQRSANAPTEPRRSVREPRPRVRRRPIERRAAVPAPTREPLTREPTASTPVAPPAQPVAPAVATARPPAPRPTALEREPSAQALVRYGQMVSELLARYRQYPHVARLRGWEGSVALRIDVGPDGKLVGATLRRSSGHDVLDEEALKMAKSVPRLPQPPEELHERPFAVDVDVVFELTP